MSAVTDRRTAALPAQHRARRPARPIAKCPDGHTVRPSHPRPPRHPPAVGSPGSHRSHEPRLAPGRHCTGQHGSAASPRRSPTQAAPGLAASEHVRPRRPRRCGHGHRDRSWHPPRALRPLEVLVTDPVKVDATRQQPTEVPGVALPSLDPGGDADSGRRLLQAWTADGPGSAAALPRNATSANAGSTSSNNGAAWICAPTDSLRVTRPH